MPALVRIESLGTFFNTLAADDKYSVEIWWICQQQLQTALSQKQKNFSAIFIAFIKPTFKFRTFWSKNVSLIVSVFPKLLTRKRWLLERPKRLASEHLSAINVFTSSQTLSKSARHHYYLIVPWIWDKLSWQKCRLVRFEILELFC